MRAKVLVKRDMQDLFMQESIWEFDYENNEDYQRKVGQLRELLARVKFEKEAKNDRGF